MNDGGASSLVYIVQYRAESANGGDYQILPEQSELRRTVNNLMPATRYNVEVRAKNANLTGPPATITVETETRNKAPRFQSTVYRFCISAFIFCSRVDQCADCNYTDSYDCVERPSGHLFCSFHSDSCQRVFAAWRLTVSFFSPLCLRALRVGSSPYHLLL